MSQFLSKLFLVIYINNCSISLKKDLFAKNQIYCNFPLKKNIYNYNYIVHRGPYGYNEKLRKFYNEFAIFFEFLEILSIETSKCALHNALVIISTKKQ